MSSAVASNGSNTVVFSSLDRFAAKNATGSPSRTQKAPASLTSGAVAPAKDATHQPARGGAPASLASTPATITDVNMVINGPAQWQTESPMANARRNAATAVVGSTLYAITGFNLAPNYTDVNERFDGTSWSARAPIPVRHAQGRAAAAGTKIYVPGGFNNVESGGPLANMQIYDTTSDSWSQGAALPAARSGVATAAFNGLVYVIAGYNPVGTGHSDVYIYDPSTNTYTSGSPMPAVAGNVPGVLLSGEIYVVGGGTAPGAHYAYNPTTNSWRTIATLPTTGGTCQSANGFVLDGELWIVGCLTLPLAQQVWIYNPGSDSWRAGPPYSVDHQGPAARCTTVAASSLAVAAQAVARRRSSRSGLAGRHHLLHHLRHLHRPRHHRLRLRRE